MRRWDGPRSALCPVLGTVPSARLAGWRMSGVLAGSELPRSRGGVFAMAPVGPCESDSCFNKPQTLIPSSRGAG